MLAEVVVKSRFVYLEEIQDGESVTFSDTAGLAALNVGY
jgi:hypothetical protein